MLMLQGTPTSDSTHAVAGSCPGRSQWRTRRYVLLLLLAVLLLLVVLLLLLAVLRPARECAVL
jgi:hypothetical protein